MRTNPEQGQRSARNENSALVVHTSGLTIDWLFNYFSRVTTEQSMTCLQEMLRVDIRQLLFRILDILGPVKLIEMSVDSGEDPKVQLKHIQATTRTVKSIVSRERNSYNPNFQKEAKLADPLLLIIVCDRFDVVHDFILYSYQNAVGGLLDKGLFATSIFHEVEQWKLILLGLKLVSRLAPSVLLPRMIPYGKQSVRAFYFWKVLRSIWDFGSCRKFLNAVQL